MTTLGERPKDCKKLNDSLNRFHTRRIDPFIPTGIKSNIMDKEEKSLRLFGFDISNQSIPPASIPFNFHLLPCGIRVVKWMIFRFYLPTSRADSIHRISRFDMSGCPFIERDRYNGGTSDGPLPKFWMSVCVTTKSTILYFSISNNNFGFDLKCTFRPNQRFCQLMVIDFSIHTYSK